MANANDVRAKDTTRPKNMVKLRISVENGASLAILLDVIQDVQTLMGELPPNSLDTDLVKRIRNRTTNLQWLKSLIVVN